MKLTYNELLDAYNNTNKQMLELLNELTDNGVIVSINAGLVENVNIHETTFSKKYKIKTSSKLDFTEHDKVFGDKIAKLEKQVEYYKKSFERCEKNCDKLCAENQSLKRRIAEFGSKEIETSAKVPISDDCRPSIGWYENRYQSDCIEINRLNTTIDVLIHKVEYLRQFAGL